MDPEEFREILREELAVLVEDMKSLLQAKGARRGGGKRKPSAYNMYVKECMGEQGKAMKTCAVEYKGLTDEEKKAYAKMAEDYGGGTTKPRSIEEKDW